MKRLQQDLLVDSAESIEELQFYLPDPLELTSNTTIPPPKEYLYGRGLSAVKERVLWYVSRPVRAVRRHRIFKQARMHY